ncbi:MAG: type II secretion system F family protein [Pseudomonadota bacterium]
MNIESFLPSGMSLSDAIVVLTSVSSLAVLTLVWFALLPADPGVRRAQGLARQREAMRSGALAPTRRKDRKQSLSMMQSLVNKLKLARSQQARKVQISLQQAGWRSDDAVVRYFFFKITLPFVFGFTALFLIYGLNAWNLEGHMKIICCIGAVVGGIYGPDLLIKNAAQKRQDAIRKALPDALDLMVICAEAGLSLDATLMRVSNEMEKATPEIADEFALTSMELGFLPDRKQAVRNLAERSSLSVMRGLSNTLLQSERYGTPLSNSLRVMSAESRNERMMKAEEKAARLPAMMTVPMIVFILPPLFVVLLGPAALSTYDNFINM